MYPLANAFVVLSYASWRGNSYERMGGQQWLLLARRRRGRWHASCFASGAARKHLAAGVWTWRKKGGLGNGALGNLTGLAAGLARPEAARRIAEHFVLWAAPARSESTVV